MAKYRVLRNRLLLREGERNEQTGRLVHKEYRRGDEVELTDERAKSLMQIQAVVPATREQRSQEQGEQSKPAAKKSN